MRKYASEEALRQAEATAVSSSSESSMSDFSEDEAQVKKKFFFVKLYHCGPENLKKSRAKKLVESNKSIL